MRNLFLILALANLLLLAWQYWLDPTAPAPSATGSSGLVVFGASSGDGPTPSGTLASQVGGKASEPGIPPGNCLRVGPLPSVAAAQQAGQRLAGRGIDAIPIARDAQLWLGHWVQIGGFASVPAAEDARKRLVSGGLADAYLMQDGAEPMISLGVFRDRDRADRVASVARRLGFEVVTRDRYRPSVEQWLLIRSGPNQTAGSADLLSLAGDRIMRTESVACEPAGGPQPPDTAPVAPDPPPQPL